MGWCGCWVGGVLVLLFDGGLLFNCFCALYRYYKLLGLLFGVFVFVVCWFGVGFLCGLGGLLFDLFGWCVCLLVGCCWWFEKFVGLLVWGFVYFVVFGLLVCLCVVCGLVCDLGWIAVALCLVGWC